MRAVYVDVCAVNAATARCSRACPCVRAGRVAYARRSLCARECGGGRGGGHSVSRAANSRDLTANDLGRKKKKKKQYLSHPSWQPSRS